MDLTSVKSLWILWFTLVWRSIYLCNCSSRLCYVGAVFEIMPFKYVFRVLVFLNWVWWAFKCCLVNASWMLLACLALLKQHSFGRETWCFPFSFSPASYLISFSVNSWRRDYNAVKSIRIKLAVRYFKMSNIVMVVSGSFLLSFVYCVNVNNDQKWKIKTSYPPESCNTILMLQLLILVL